MKQNEQTAEVFADDILETRPDWRPEDVMLFCKYIRQEGGAVNTRTLNVLQLTDLLAGYEDRRSEQRELMYREQKQKFLEADRTPATPIAEQHLRELRERLEGPKAAIPKHSDTEPLEIKNRVNGFVADFHNGKDKDGFINHNGYDLTLDDYIQIRLNEYQASKQS